MPQYVLNVLITTTLMRIQHARHALRSPIAACVRLQLRAGYAILGTGLITLRMALALCVISISLAAIYVTLLAHAAHVSMSTMSILLLIIFAPIAQCLSPTVPFATRSRSAPSALTGRLLMQLLDQSVNPVRQESLIVSGASQGQCARHAIQNTILTRVISVIFAMFHFQTVISASMTLTALHASAVT